MDHEIRPLALDDLPDLSRFLTTGFHAPADASFASVPVLMWKYLDFSDGLTRSWLAKDGRTGQIVGCLGVCRTHWRGAVLSPEGVSTLHMIDWLTSESGRGVGASLMRRAHAEADTQYVLGASAAARKVLDRAGYALLAKVPVFQRVLRPTYRLRATGSGPMGRVLRAAKDTMGLLNRRPRAPGVAVELKPVSLFSEEIEPILDAYEANALFTSREPSRLNALLNYPHGKMTGWHLFVSGALRGFALLNIVARKGVREGRIVECLLDLEGEAWHGAINALTSELNRQGADVAVGFASSAWTAAAYRDLGFAQTHAIEFRLRDRAGRLPKVTAWHLSALEADYAYT